MIKILTISMLLASLISCSSVSSKDIKDPKNSEELLERAEANASIGGRKVLEAGREMIAAQDVIVGGCWNYIDAVYNRAGFPDKERSTIYKSKFHGPYTSTDTFEAGDWLYFVNHSYNDIEHSAIFVTWIDQDQKIALMVNYAGGNKKKPATYKSFVLDNVYNVIRAKAL